MKNWQKPLMSTYWSLGLVVLRSQLPLQQSKVAEEASNLSLTNHYLMKTCLMNWTFIWHLNIILTVPFLISSWMERQWNMSQKWDKMSKLVSKQKSLLIWKKSQDAATNPFGNYGNQNIQITPALKNVQKSVLQLLYPITGNTKEFCNLLNKI